MKLSLPTLSAVFALVAFVDATPIDERTVYCPAVIMPTPPVVALPGGTAVSGLELNNSGGIATLTTTGLLSGWNFGSGGLGYPWCPTKAWLNIGSGSQPWKPLVWGSSQSTTTWIAGYNKYLTANATSSYAQTSDFLACKPLGFNATTFTSSPKWTLFLLTTGVAPTASDATLANVDVSSCVKTKLYIESGSGSEI